MAYQKLGDILPCTVDLLRSKNFHAVEPFPIIKKELDKLLEKNDTTKALWWLNQFTTYNGVYTEAHLMTLRLLKAQNKWDNARRQMERALRTEENGRTIYPPRA